MPLEQWLKVDPGKGSRAVFSQEGIPASSLQPFPVPARSVRLSRPAILMLEGRGRGHAGTPANKKKCECTAPRLRSVLEYSGGEHSAQSNRWGRCPAAAAAREPNPLKRVFKILGPGLISGAADDDPSAIGTYAVAGASLGYATLWTALVTLPMMASTQFIYAKIGMVSGKGLSGVLQRFSPRSLLYPVVFCLVIANTINTGADIGAIVAAVNMFAPIPIAALIIPIALIILALQIWGSYLLIVRTFKWLTLALFAYLGASLFARPPVGEVLRATFVPL